MGRIINTLAMVMAVAVTITGSEPALADDELTLAPSAEWRFREYDDRCRASRTFGEGKDRTTLWIEQGGEDSNYNLTLIGRPLRHPYGPGIHIRFGDEPETIRSYISAKSSKGRPVLRMYGVNFVQPEMEKGQSNPTPDLSVDAARLDAIDSLSLRSAIVKPIQLKIGSMSEPYAFLNICGAKLSVLLSEAGRPLSAEARPPTPIDPEDWLRDKDYPAYLARARMEGELSVRITVNTAGKASSCFVVESNKPQLFDDTVCLGLMRRARFEPALNASGEAVPSYYFYKVTFRME